MKWSRLVFVLLKILISLLPVVSMNNNCTQDISSTLRSLTRQADVICEAAVKKAPSYSARPPGVVFNKFVSNRPVAGDTVTIKVRRILKGGKKLNITLLSLKIPKRDIVNSCVLQLKKGDKLIFFLKYAMMDGLRFEMITPPVNPTKTLNRKLRRHLSRTNFTRELKKKNRKVAEGKKLKLTCTSSDRNAKFRWLRNGKVIRKSSEMSFKKKNQGKANPKSVLRIRQLRQNHTGVYTCTIDVGGKKYSKDFNITVIGPSEVQCADQKYCLNQGECWQKLPPLDEKYCKCHMNFSGLRCESVSINSSLLRNLQSEAN